MERLRACLCVTVISLLCSGCAIIGQTYAFRDNLANRGPVALSTSNPYIASNILLSKEIASSSTLRGFLKVRGNPEAIEIKKVLLRPYMMYFFYPVAHEVYILEESSNEWIIRGPQTIPPDVMGVVSQVVPKNTEPPAVLEAPVTTTSELALETGAVAADRPSDIPEAASIEAIRPARTSMPAPRTAHTSAAHEKADGDIIHTVTHRGETLRIIANWYAGAPETAEKIARINGLKDANNLTIGQDIRIPRYLVKNNEPLTQKAVDDYKAAH